MRADTVVSRESSLVLSGREGHFYEDRGTIETFHRWNLSTDQNAPISLHPLCVVFFASQIVDIR